MTRRATFDAQGSRAERLSEYFDFSGPDGKDKAQRPVRRFEFQAILDRLERARKARRFWPRLWRYMTSPLDWRSAGLPAPTQREIARGEGTPEGGRDG